MENQVKNLEEKLMSRMAQNKDIVDILKQRDASSNSIYWVMRSLTKADHEIDELLHNVLDFNQKLPFLGFKFSKQQEKISQILEECKKAKEQAEKNLSESIFFDSVKNGWIKIQYNAKARRKIKKILMSAVNNLIDRNCCWYY